MLKGIVETLLKPRFKFQFMLILIFSYTKIYLNLIQYKRLKTFDIFSNDLLC